MNSYIQENVEYGDFFSAFFDTFKVVLKKYRGSPKVEWGKILEIVYQRGDKKKIYEVKANE